MEFQILSFYLVSLSVLGLFLVFQYTRRSIKKSLPLPPGPPGQFIIGHLRKIPFEDPFVAYLNWGKEYKSDVLYFNTLGQPIVVLNSVKACVELLDKRGSNYSDRPRFVLLELLGWGMTLTWLRWGPKMQQHRKILQAPFTKSRVGSYQGLQLEETRKVVKSIMQNPLGWRSELRRFAIAIVANVAFGVNISSIEHPCVRLSDDAGFVTGRAGTPGASLPDRFPAVRFLPDWLPGLHSLKYAHDNKHLITNIHEIPFQGALKEIDEESGKSAFVHRLLGKYRDNEKKGLPNEFTLADIKGAAGAIIIAGSETTLTTIIVFILMMMSNPEVQRKAQAEIDLAIGSNRLPEFEDLDKLTYLTRVRQEVYRIAPLNPLGIPHRNLSDDIYNEMFIPKGSIIYQNVYAMHRDPEMYSNPLEFDPDRYIPIDEGGKGEPFPYGNFGFGRRICPGQFLADNTISIVIATVLSTLNIDWPTGESGKPTPFIPEWSKVGMYSPLAFQCSMEPRTGKAKDFISDSG